MTATIVPANIAAMTGNSGTINPPMICTGVWSSGTSNEIVVAVSVSFTDVCWIVSVQAWTAVMLAIKLFGSVNSTSPVPSN
jgi:hypothetical protein